ncbi:MAG: sigma-54 dependent transcriptional regulator [Pseudomonadota bacterium]
MTQPRVLFVDDEEHLRLAAQQSLELQGIEVDCFAAGAPALSKIDRAFNGILVTDIRMSGMDGLELMAQALARDPDLPVILITGHGDVALAVASLRDGAYDFIEKPFAPATLVDSVRRAMDKRQLTLENRALRQSHTGGDGLPARLIGRSAVVRKLRDEVRAVAGTDADALILGATGTGKEVVARVLHDLSDRAKGPFIQINCAALPDSLVESELFGHEAGAFPGATRARYGKFEHGRGGTVFLDEIDSLAPALQAKLLNAIENRQITRLGSNEQIPLNVRFLAASKSDLKAESETGHFRSDLYYRLNVVTLHLPGLEARREDIPLLFAHFAAEAAERVGRAAPEIPGRVLQDLAARPWPGHVRELRNAAERYVLGLEFDRAGQSAQAGLAVHMAAFEKSLIAASIAAHGGSLKATYEALGISRKALYEKMQRHGLTREDFREDV